MAALLWSSRLQKITTKLSRIRSFMLDDWRNPAVPTWTIPMCFLNLYYPSCYLWDALVARKNSEKLVLDHGLLLDMLLLLAPLIYIYLSSYLLVPNSLMEIIDRSTPRIDEEFFARPEDTYTHDRSIPDRFYETDRECGLTEGEVHKRQRAWGFNEVRPASRWPDVILRECASVLGQLLKIAVTIHTALHCRWADCTLNSMLVAWNLFGGVYNQREKEDIWRKDAWDPSTPAVALRGGKITQVTTRELVPGDVIHVSEGLLMPADAMVIGEDSKLWVVPPSSRHLYEFKPRGDLCLIGQKVLSGNAFLLVIHTGPRTVDTRMSHWITGRHWRSNEYVRASNGVGALIAIIIAATMIVFATTPQHSRPPLYRMPELLASLAIIITNHQPSSNDETSNGLNCGQMAEMSLLDYKPGFIIEALAGVDVLCVEKRPNVVENKRRVLGPLCFHCSEDDLVRAAALSSEGANGFDSIGFALDSMVNRLPRVKSKSTRHRTIEDNLDKELGITGKLIEFYDGQRVSYVRGPVHGIRVKLRHEHSISKVANRWLKLVTLENARRGLDTIAVARKPENGNWELLGVLPTLDTPRFESSWAIRMAAELGVSVKVFGDEAKELAEGMAGRIGLRANAMTATEALSTSADTFAITDAFAECNLSDQTAIVLAARERHRHRVAAVSRDAHALETVDCGLHLGSSEEQLHPSADVGLLKDGIVIVMKGIVRARARFILKHGTFCDIAASALSLVLILLWHFGVHGEIIDLRMWLVGISIMNIIVMLGQLWFKWPQLEIRLSRKPITWTRYGPLQESFPYALIVAFGYLAQGLACRTVIPQLERDKMQAQRSQAVCLYLLVVNPGMRTILITGVNFWTKKYAKRYMIGYASLGLIWTALCMSGLVMSNAVLDPVAYAIIWVVSLTTLGVAGLVNHARTRNLYFFPEVLDSLWPNYRFGLQHLG